MVLIIICAGPLGHDALQEIIKQFGKKAVLEAIRRQPDLTAEAVALSLTTENSAYQPLLHLVSGAWVEHFAKAEGVH